MSNTNSSTSSQFARANALIAEIEASLEEQPTSRTSSSGASSSKQKGDWPPETGPSLLLSYPAIPASTYASSSPPITGQPSATQSGTQAGQKETSLSTPSERSYPQPGWPTLGIDPEKFYSPAKPAWEDMPPPKMREAAERYKTLVKQPEPSNGLPTSDAERKALPIWTYLMGYFPDALLAEVGVAVAGNAQHNAGQPLHWAREKSKDQLNTAFRHMWDHGRGVTKDTDGQYHLAKAIWRLKAELQLTIERDKQS